MNCMSELPNIIATIRKAWPVSDESLADLAALMTMQELPKRTLLVREGALSGRVYFLERGMARCYWIVDGEEITTSFSTEGGLLFSMDEFYYGMPSQEYVESVEPVLVGVVAMEPLSRLISSRLDLANWSRVIHQNEYRRLHRSHKERLTLPARERYAAFASQFPDVNRRARLTDIASYLGITPSTLSRIRAGSR